MTQSRSETDPVLRDGNWAAIRIDSNPLLRRPSIGIASWFPTTSKLIGKESGEGKWAAIRIDSNALLRRLGKLIAPGFRPLCSDARLNVDFDLTLTVLADLLYRRLAERLKGFVRTSPARLFRKFIATPGMIEIRANEVIVHLSKRAHIPLLKEAGLTKPTGAVPWLGGRLVRLACP